LCPIYGDKAIVTRAFGADDRDASVRAIEGLAIRHPETAFDAAERALHQRGKSRAPFVDVLFNIDSLRAVEVACLHMKNERNVLVRRYIGRALRRNDSAAVRERIESLLACTEPTARAAGCELAGWFDDFASDRLQTLALKDMDPMVRAIVMGGVFAQLDRRRVRPLLEGLRIAEGSKVWALMQLIVDTGDPLLVLDRGDPMWLGAALNQKAAALVQYAQERSATRWKKYAEAANDDMRDDYYR
jgi:hypothetical protein